jgi:pimeloyl-ACP methyl ester carboxylesterase
MPTLDLDGRRFEYVERGSGAPVLFVHGSASDHRTWQSQLEHFGRSYRAIAYSRRYHWPNERIPEGADYAMLEHVDDLQALVRALGLEGLHLVGHSYGGFVSLLFALREPQRLRTLVLEEPPVLPLVASNPPRPAEMLRLLVTDPRLALAIVKFGARGLGPATAAARRGDMDTAMNIFGAAVLGAETFRRLSAARREQVAANAFRAEFLGSGFAPLAANDVRRIAVPTLLIAGADSPAIFPRLLDRLEALLPRAQRVTIPAASHIVHEDAPSAYDAAVGAFLAAHTPR